MAVKRVFVTKHYIDCVWFDIETIQEKEDVKALAEKAAAALGRTRADAVDNGWHADDLIVSVDLVGYSHATPEGQELPLVLISKYGGKVFLGG